MNNAPQRTGGDPTGANNGKPPPSDRKWDGRWQLRFCHPFHQPLPGQAIGDQLGNCDELQIMLFGNLLEFRAPRHGPVFLQDLAYHAGGGKTGETCQVNGCLRLADPAQYASRPGP